MRRTAILVLALVLMLSAGVSAQQKVTAYTTLFEPTARLVFEEFRERDRH